MQDQFSFLIEKEFDHDGILCDDGKVEGVLPVVLLGHVNIVDGFWVGLKDTPREQKVCLTLSCK